MRPFTHAGHPPPPTSRWSSRLWRSIPTACTPTTPYSAFYRQRSPMHDNQPLCVIRRKQAWKAGFHRITAQFRSQLSPEHPRREAPAVAGVAGGRAPHLQAQVQFLHGADLGHQRDPAPSPLRHRNDALRGTSTGAPWTVVYAARPAPRKPSGLKAHRELTSAWAVPAAASELT